MWYDLYLHLLNFIYIFFPFCSITNGGKTTLCQKLVECYPAITVISMDDFFWVCIHVNNIQNLSTYWPIFSISSHTVKLEPRQVSFIYMLHILGAFLHVQYTFCRKFVILWILGSWLLNTIICIFFKQTPESGHLQFIPEINHDNWEGNTVNQWNVEFYIPEGLSFL